MTYSNKELLKAAHMTITELELEIADLKSQLKEEMSDILKITSKDMPCFLRINKIRNIVKLKTNQL